MEFLDNMSHKVNYLIGDNRLDKTLFCRIFRNKGGFRFGYEILQILSIIKIYFQVFEYQHLFRF